MRFLVNREALIAPLDAASTVARGNRLKPVLECVLLAAENGALRVSATNLDVSFRATIGQVDIGEPGMALALAVPIRGIAHASRSETLVIETDADNVYVSDDCGRHQIHALPAADFPPITGTDLPVSAKLSCSAFRLMISGVAYAVADSQTRYAFSSIQLRAETKHLVARATEGHMAVSWTADNAAIETPFCVLVLGSTLESICKSAPDDDSELVIAIDRNRAAFRWTGTEWGVPLMEGNFVDDDYFRDIVTPPKGGPAFTVESKPLIEALKLLSLANTNSAAFEFTKSGLKLSTLPDAGLEYRGDATRTVPGELTGDECDVHMNMGYVSEAVSATGHPVVKLIPTCDNKRLVVSAGTSYAVICGLARR